MSVNTNHSANIVMIIDDTPENLALLSDTLSEAGYRVLVATDGQSALDQINFLQPDIILLDVLMPGMNGFETCKLLKKNNITASIPVIFMTALSELDDLLKAFEEGAVDYLVKPIRPPEVLARVDVQLRQAQNLKRAEAILNNSPYSALTVTQDGSITWLPETACLWLRELMLPKNSTTQFTINQPLPEPLLDWFLTKIPEFETLENQVFEKDLGGCHFSLKHSASHVTNEYLILIEKRSSQWNLDSLKYSLGLTLREAEILMWISRGKTNKEVGLILDSSPRTVNKHLEHIFEKLGVATRAAAVSVAMHKTINLNTPSGVV